MTTAGLDELIAAAARGDDDAFAEIFRSYHPRVWRAAYARLGNRADADDATADAFTRLHRAVRRYERRPNTSFDAFLLRIADRAALDVHRRRRRHQADTLVQEPGAPGPAETPLDGHLHVAFSRLSAGERELLTLRVVEGRSADEVAALLGRSPGAVRVAQHRALSRLRAILEEVQHGR